MKLMDVYFKELEDHQKIYGKDKSILLMQVGSFYEAYQTDTLGFDLKIISELTNFIITKRDKSNPVTNIDNPFTLGFPLNSLNKYVRILTDAGYQVKVVDQNNNSKYNSKITRHTKAIYSSGTMIDLDHKDNNYILGLWFDNSDDETNIIGITIADISTGEWEIKDCLCLKDDKYQSLDEVCRYINMYNPVEIVLSSNTTINTSIIKYLELEDKNYYIFDSKNKLFHKLVYQNETLAKIFNQKNSIEYLDIEEYHYGRISLMLLIDYIEMHNPDLLKNLTNVRNYIDQQHLYLGNNALNQLYVLSSEGLQNKIGNRFKSLFDVINITATPMGRRRLKRELTHPLINTQDIQTRYDLIQKIAKHTDELKNELQYITDIEKMQKKLQIGELSPYDLYKWIVSYERILNVEKIIDNIYPLKSTNINGIYTIMNKTFNTEKLSLFVSIMNIKDNLFQPKINKELDAIQQKLDDNREILNKIAEYITNIGDKKGAVCSVVFNERDGHHLYTTKKRWQSTCNLVTKEDCKIEVNKKSIVIQFTKFVGKDNSATGTKIFSDELKKISDELISYENKLSEKMQEEYVKFSIEFTNKYKNELSEIINWVSYIDFLYSGSQCMKKYFYTIPIIIEDSKSWLDASKIRHPIVERISTNYIPFDIQLGKEYTGITLFGLNSAGKSTLQKSVGLNIILAQIGYPVACDKLLYSPYHSLFTRISGNDNLFKGLSSFSVEMLEIRNILKRTNNRSLIIADEVCRGTEYESGLIIVLTMIKILSEKQSNFITASHLHQIVNSDIYKQLKNVKSYHIHISYDEATNIIKYDRILREGSGDNFYGLLVAKNLIDDREFVQLSTDIKTEILDIKKETSRYNTKILKSQCQICKLSITTNSNSTSLETHHIVFQKDADENGIINSNGMKHKNNTSNLIVVCQKCHDDIDRGNIVVTRKIETSKGEELDITYVEDTKIENIPDSEESKIEEVEEKVINLSKKKLNQKLIKERLSKENINISVAKISKILNKFI